LYSNNLQKELLDLKELREKAQLATLTLHSELVGMGPSVAEERASKYYLLRVRAIVSHKAITKQSGRERMYYNRGTQGKRSKSPEHSSQTTTCPIQSWLGWNWARVGLKCDTGFRDTINTARAGVH